VCGSRTKEFQLTHGIIGSSSSSKCLKDLNECNAEFMCQKDRGNKTLGTHRRPVYYLHVFVLLHKRKEISPILDVFETSDFIMSSWQGVLLQMKVTRSTVPFHTFDKMIFEVILK
jgi:hypothetical protein